MKGNQGNLNRGKFKEGVNVNKGGFIEVLWERGRGQNHDLNRGGIGQKECQTRLKKARRPSGL